MHQLAHQVQANLEHYQQAMQSLRSEQTLEIEKREADFQHDIQELKQNLSLAQQKISTLQEHPVPGFAIKSGIRIRLM